MRTLRDEALLFVVTVEEFVLSGLEQSKTWWTRQQITYWKTCIHLGVALTRCGSFPLTQSLVSGKSVSAVCSSGAYKSDKRSRPQRDQEPDIPGTGAAL